MPEQDGVGGIQADPGLTPWINTRTGKIAGRRVHTCGYCGNQFYAMYKNSRLPCPQCRSFKRPTAQEGQPK